MYSNALFSLIRKHSLATLSCVVVTVTLGVSAVQAQVAGDRVSVPLSDPTRAATLKVSVLTGSITVKAYEGKELIVEAKVRERETRAQGNMRRIPMTSTGLAVEEENNSVRVSVDSNQRAIDVTISTPVNTSVNLRSVNDGDIEVTGLSGEIDVNNINGDVVLKNVAGNVVAHALNGKVHVTFTSINDKPMAFSSMNGTIDVTFPATLKANVNLTNNQGDVFSDFEVVMQPSAPQQVIEDGRGKGGKFRVKIDRTVRGTINGGGPEMRFKNFNGDIYIRKASGATQD